MTEPQTEPLPEDHAEPRTYGRLPLGIAAHLDTIHGRKAVRLVDLSQGGAKIVLPIDIPIRDCVLTWLEFEAFCSAVWHDGPRLGLTFEEPLPLATLVATRNVAPSIIRAESLSVETAARAWVRGE